MRAWLRKNSALFAIVSPPTPIVERCDSCGERNTVGYHYDTSMVGHELRTKPKHRTGTVHYGKRGEVALYCDGSEE